MLLSRGPVAALTPRDEAAALELCARDPEANVFVAARIAEGALRTQPGTLLGWRDEAAPTGWGSLLWAGANVVPVGITPQHAMAYAHRLRRRARYSSSCFGPRDQVMQLWSHLASSWGEPRAVRRSQPVLATRRPPRSLGVACDERVRPARPDEVDLVVPAAAAMFTDEIGYPPYSGSPAGYRRAVAALVEAGRTYVVSDGSRVVFKADVGSVALGVAQVQGVWLAPDLRGHGLATPAMASVVEAVLADHAGTVSLYVNDFNHAARATYARVGMEQVGEFVTILF